MAVVYDLVKDRETYSVDADQTVMEVVRFMMERNIGAVAVTSGGELAGIFSERDLMKRVVGEERDAKRTRVREVMTANPLVVAPDKPLEACLALMKEHSFRHLPVCEGKKLKGFLSLRDLLQHAVVEKDGEVRWMRDYIARA
jgi:CBS domain-containing protein